MTSSSKEIKVWKAVMEEVSVYNWTEWLSDQLSIEDEDRLALQNYPCCCPACFQPVEAPYSKCKTCGAIFDSSVITELRDTAFDYARFAWQYKKQYESDLKRSGERQITRYYCLEPPNDWLTYLSSIVIAAIIGGISYDLFKVIIKTISRTFRAKFRISLPSEKWLQDLFNSINEYHKSTQDPNSEIFKLYMKGLIKSAIEMAAAECDPDYLNNMKQFLQELDKFHNSGVTSMQVEPPQPKIKPPDGIIEKHITNIGRKNKRRFLKLKRLQKLIKHINSSEDKNDQ